MPKKKTNWYVFLAGPIQGAPNWQFDMPAIDGVTWLSPRRGSYKDFNYEEQTTWETNCMRLADVILFWIPEKAEVIEGRDYAQTTRTEFGEYIAKGKKVICGIHKDFSGRRYFETKAKQYGLSKIHDNIADIITELKDYIKGCNKNKQTYFISDTHFGSDRTLELSKRPFKSVDDMDWTMIQRWNDTIHPNDTVYHLGDFGDLKYLQYLNGNKNFISGNYERKDDQELTNSAIRKKYLSAGFDEYLTDHFTLDYKGTTYVAAHEPLRCLYYMNELNSDKSFGIFGHIHGRQFIKQFGIDAGVDCHNFAPVSIEDIDFFRNAVQKGFYDAEVWSMKNSMPTVYEQPHRVFLGGTCNNSAWRKELISMLKIDYFNPVVKDWNEEAQKNEELEKQVKCDLQLYVITPKMNGVFSIAEAVESAINNGDRTVFCVLEKDYKGSRTLEFEDFQIKSLNAVKDQLKKYGAFVCNNLDTAAKYLNDYGKK